ncbi:hypothetical protein, partial [Rahnella variigena]|uniref:hypothetical protein n=1 Tax=Rahnella variigena TaxID=574964 RepID=UPI00244C1116
FAFRRKFKPAAIMITGGGFLWRLKHSTSRSDWGVNNTTNVSSGLVKVDTPLSGDLIFVW